MHRVPLLALSCPFHTCNVSFLWCCCSTEDFLSCMLAHSTATCIDAGSTAQLAAAALTLLCPSAPAAGKHIQGKVTTTISRGRLVWHDGKLDVAKGSGRMLQLPPFGPLFTGLEKQGASTAEQLINAFASRHGATPVSRGAGSAEGVAAQPGREEL